MMFFDDLSEEYSFVDIETGQTVTKRRLMKQYSSLPLIYNRLRELRKVKKCRFAEGELTRMKSKSNNWEGKK